MVAVPPPPESADTLVRAAVAAMVARDPAAARPLLRRAVEIGHVDAALMEAAMVANGSGGSADWAGAVRLLRAAATRDPVAARQLTLLDEMALNDEGAPIAVPAAVRLSDAPRVSAFNAFLSPAECQHVAATAHELMEPSRVVDPASGRTVAHPIRRCDNAVIGPTREDLVIRAINRRIAAASGTRVEQGESLTVLRYGPGHEFRSHHDALPGAANQRIKTLLIYLNEGFVGGETQFVHGNIVVTPRGGDAILFDNVDASGAIDPRSVHAGLPVVRGTKWLATRWIRADTFDPWDRQAYAQ